MADHDVYQAKFRTGDSRETDGKTLMEAARKGTIWMNVREGMNLHAEYKALLDEMYGDLAELTGNKPYKPRGGISITSPLAQTPYHCDPTLMILWHVRGHKRFISIRTRRVFCQMMAMKRFFIQHLRTICLMMKQWSKKRHLMI